MGLRVSCVGFLLFLLTWEASAHVVYGPLQKLGKLLLLLRSEALDHLGFNFLHGLIHPVVALVALVKQIDPLAPAIFRIGAKFQKAFLLQPGQKSRNGRMAQMKLIFDVPGTGGCF